MGLVANETTRKKPEISGEKRIRQEEREEEMVGSADVGVGFEEDYQKVGVLGRGKGKSRSKVVRA